MNAMVRNLSARLEADIDSFHESEGVAGCSTVLARDMLKMIEDMADTAGKRNRVIRRLRRRGDDRQITIINLRRKLAWALESAARQRANAEAHGRRSRTVQPIVGASGLEATCTTSAK